MPQRFPVDINNFPTPYSTLPNPSAARIEERRLERIYGATQNEPQKSNIEILREDGARIRGKHREAVQDRLQFSTSESKAQVLFAGRQYTLPPVRSQEFDHVHKYGSIELQFGGLGLTSKMVDWLRAYQHQARNYGSSASNYNELAEKKATTGLFKKKTRPYVAAPRNSKESFDGVFNKKLAAARIPIRLERIGGEFVFVHPSSETGNLSEEMKSWADRYWVGVQERPWQDSIIEFPTVPRVLGAPVPSAADLSAAMEKMTL